MATRRVGAALARLGALGKLGVLGVLGALTAAAGCSGVGGAPATAGYSQGTAPPPGCSPAPLGATTLYLRGSMNQWQPDDAGEFVYRCDAYYLNVQWQGTQQFKIADDAWRADTIFGGPPGAPPVAPSAVLSAVLSRGTTTSNLMLSFAGSQHLRLAFDGGQPRLALLAGQVALPAARPITNPVALSLRHDSRALADKQPFGAVPAGTEVVFGFSALPGVAQATLVIERRRLEGDQTLLAYEGALRLPMQREAGTTADTPANTTAGTQRFSARYRFDAIGVYGYWFELSIAGQAYALHNNDDTIYWTREKGSNGAAQVAWRPDAERKLRRLRLSVYDPGFAPPAWAVDAVYYYVFPERFRNGDRTNDPQPGSRRYQTHDIERHPRWLDTPYKPGSGDGSDEVHNNDYFGGDLAGLIDKLDYIRALGANTIYMTPVFTGASNHKYDTADYHRIDPAFGNNADFTRLTQQAAQRGLRVILDTSLNHTGSDSIYFDRYGNHAGQGQGGTLAAGNIGAFATGNIGAFAAGNIGAFSNGRIRPESPYASWYRFDTSTADPDRQYTGWGGTPDLPELDKNAPAWRDFAYRAPDSVSRRWLQAGAAGWRMDVAPWVPDDFWREWRTTVKQTDPQALTIAETWFDASKHLLGDMFDSTMNYIFRNAVLDYAAGGPAPVAVRNLELVRELYPPPAFQVLMNLLSSHDAARALHRFGDLGPASSAAAKARAKQRLRLALLFQVSYPGAPAVYYGDEVGLTGGDDPYNRAPYPWADEGGAPDLALLADFKRLIALRQQHPVLRRSTLLAPLLVDDQVVVLARRLATAAGSGPATGATGATWAITATNNSDSARTVTVALPAGLPPASRFSDALSGPEMAAAGGRLTLTVPALFGRVLIAMPGVVN